MFTLGDIVNNRKQPTSNKNKKKKINKKSDSSVKYDGTSSKKYNGTSAKKTKLPLKFEGDIAENAQPPVKNTQPPVKKEVTDNNLNEIRIIKKLKKSKSVKKELFPNPFKKQQPTIKKK